MAPTNLRVQSERLQAEKAELVAEFDDILASTERSPEQSARLETIEQRVDAIHADLDRIASRREWERDEAKAVETFGAASSGPDNTDGPRPYSNLGEQLRSVYRAAMGYGTDDRLMTLNAAAIGSGEAIGSEGGFLVQQDFAAEIFRKMTSMSSLLPRVRRQNVSGNGLVMRTVKETSRATGSRWGGVQGYWVDEGTAPTASQPAFGRLNIPLEKVAALGYSTDELLDDAPAMSGIYTEAFAEELVWLVENSIINGTGAGQPVGLLNAAATVSQAKETGQAASTINTTNLSKMWSRLHVRSRANAVWYVNQDVEPELDELFITAGTGGLNPRVVSYGPDGVTRIKGRPVEAIEFCATLGTVGDIILADLSQYMLIDKNGVRQDTSMHVRFTTDEMAFRAIYRVGGMPLWEAALTPANGSNTTSPYVTLATRA